MLKPFRLVSAVLFPIIAVLGTVAAADAQQMENNTDRWGSDLNCVYPVGSPGECRDMCQSTQDCLAFTWVRPGYVRDEPVCCLKNPVPAPSRNDCCVSGVIAW